MVKRDLSTIHLWVHIFPRLEQTLLNSKLLNSKPNYPKNPSCLIWILSKKRFYKLRKKAPESIHQQRCNKTKPIILLGFVKSTPILHSQSVLLEVPYTPKDIRSSKKKFIICRCANSVDMLILCTPNDISWKFSQLPRKFSLVCKNCTWKSGSPLCCCC